MVSLEISSAKKKKKSRTTGEDPSPSLEPAASKPDDELPSDPSSSSTLITLALRLAAKELIMQSFLGAYCVQKSNHVVAKIKSP